MKSLEALERIKENTQVNHDALMKGYEWPKSRSNPSLEGDIELIEKELKQLEQIKSVSGNEALDYFDKLLNFLNLTDINPMDIAHLSLSVKNYIIKTMQSPTSDEVCEALKEEDEFNGCEVTFEDEGDKIRFRIHFGEYKFDTCFTYFVYHDQVNFEAYDYISLKTYKMMVDFFDNYKKELEETK